jgi:hypothetical protein
VVKMKKRKVFHIKMVPTNRYKTNKLTVTTNLVGDPSENDDVSGQPADPKGSWTQPLVRVPSDCGMAYNYQGGVGLAAP